jgi:hypothetical protein
MTPDLQAPDLKALSRTALGQQEHDIGIREDDRRMGERIGADIVTLDGDGRLVFSFIAGCEKEAADIRKELLATAKVRHVLADPTLSHCLAFQILTWSKGETGENECRGEVLSLVDVERTGP